MFVIVMHAAVFLGLTRALRPGEILGLQWENLDLEGETPTVTIKQSLIRREGELRIGNTKTKQSERVLQLPEITRLTLKNHQKAQAKERIRKADFWTDMDLVFPNEKGTLWDPSNFRREFKKLTLKADIGDWRPNEMRHTSISLLSHVGEPLENLADLAGHRDLRMVTQTYRHHLGGTIDGGVERATQLFGDDVSVSA